MLTLVPDPVDPTTQARRDAQARANDALWQLYREGAARRAERAARFRWPECRGNEATR